MYKVYKPLYYMHKLNKNFLGIFRADRRTDGQKVGY